MPATSRPPLLTEVTPSLHTTPDGDWRVFFVTAIGVFLVFMNMTTMDVALPSVVRYFSASPTQANWILLGYMLTNTVMILAFGRLADLFGRKKLYLWGIGVFTVASFLCGVSQSANMLIVMRVFQAIGAASIFTNTTPLLADAFAARRLPSVLGLNATTAAASSVCGPLIGGALVHAFDWRVLFFINVPFGLVSLYYGRRILRNLPATVGETFDVAGMLLSFLTLGSLVFGLSEGGMMGWASPAIVTAFVVCAISGVLFVLVQLQRRHPLVDLALMRDKRLVLGFFAHFGSSMVQISVVLLLSLFLQAAVNMNPLQAGARVMPLAAGMMGCAFLSGRLSQRISGNLVAAGGMSLLALSLLGLMLSLHAHVGGGGASGSQGGWAVMLFMLTSGMGIGLFTTPNTSAIIGAVAPARRGIANGLRSMMQNCGYVVGTALSLAIITSPLTPVAKNAIYSGDHSRLDADQVAAFVGQYHTAFAVLACLAVACASASYLRGKIKVQPGPDARA